MERLVNRVNERLENVREPLRKYPLMDRALVLTATAVVYLAVVLAVDFVSGDAVFPVLLVAMYFMPAVLRAWVLFYEQVRKEVKHLGGDCTHPTV